MSNDEKAVAPPVEFMRYEPPPRPPPSPEEEKLEYTIAVRMDKLESITDPAVLNKLREDLYSLGDLRSRRFRMMNFGPHPLFYEDHLKIVDRLRTLSPPEFKLPVEPPLDVTQLPGGYHLKHRSEDWSFSLSPWNYCDLMKAWDNPDQLPTPEALIEYLDEHCCSDWSKQDENGECYGGHWAEPEGSERYENAYEWSRRDNLEALSKLPYPSRAIIWTVEWGCSIRQECVAFTVLCCEWFKRKREQMKDVPVDVMEPFSKAEEEIDGYPESMVIPDWKSPSMARLLSLLQSIPSSKGEFYITPYPVSNSENAFPLLLMPAPRERDTDDEPSPPLEDEERVEKSAMDEVD